jgi:glucose/arabinose dehydrogenase
MQQYYVTLSRYTSPSFYSFRAFRFLLLLVSSWLCTRAPSAAQSVPSGFNVSTTQAGYDQPMGVVFQGQQQFVWEKAGRVWVSTWNGVEYVKQPTAVLDISEEVGNWRDFGLYGLAFDPNFSTNGYVYLYYVVDRHHLLHFGTPTYSPTTDEYYNASISRLTRYTLVNTNGAVTTDYNSRHILIGQTKSTGIPLTHVSHVGGTILFGQDGTLLLSTGDNASFSLDQGSAYETYYQQALDDLIMTPAENVGAFRSQMISSMCGKILRLDPSTGEGISSNPFYDAADPGSAKSRVWALGLRNPFRMTIQPNTGSSNPADANPGTLLIGDAGWDTWEELHIISQGGQNAGWPIFEGLEPGAFQTPADWREDLNEPNPTNTCGKPYMRFSDLLKQITDPAPVVNNPCSGQPLPGLQRRYVHSPPALLWQHGQDSTHVPTFQNGLLVRSPVSPTGVLCTGTPFRGTCAVGGAFFPDNVTFPTEWQNTYFFADYGANWIKAATLGPNGTVTQVRDFLPPAAALGIVDIEYSPLDGSLYYIDVYTGEVKKISYGGNRPPVAVAAASSLTGASPLSITFTGSDSYDPDGDALTYLWDFGDGNTSTQDNPVHVFTSPVAQGYTVSLTVTDALGLSDTETLQVSLNNAAPTVQITNPINNSLYPLDQASNYALTATVTDETPSSLTYAWQVTLRHNTHEHREPINNQVSPVVPISPVGCDGETYYYMISLKVTDVGGLTAQDSVKIYPDCNSPSLAVTGLTATTLSNGRVQLSWTNPGITFDNVLVAGKAGAGFTDKPTNSTYPADPSFTGNGAPLDGGKVLYQGAGTSVLVTNLTEGETYYFRVFTHRGSSWTGGVEISATPPGVNSITATLVANASAVCPGNPVDFSITVGGLLAGQTYSYTLTNGTNTISDSDLSLTDLEASIVPTVSGSFTLTVRSAGAGTASVETGPIILSNGSGPISTLKNGAWSDPTVWSVCRPPLPGEAVEVSHTISILPGTFSVGPVTYRAAGKLVFADGGTVRIQH